MSIRYLLDTDTSVGWLRGHTPVRRKITDVGASTIGFSIITLSELRYGASCSAQPASNHQSIDDFLIGITVVSLEIISARIFGDIKAFLRSQGQLLEDADLLIAATALTFNLTLVTNNVRHFSRIPHLVIESWN